jgi:hypothetical protein
MIEINSKFKSLITTQSYKSKDAIEDVKLIDLPLYNDDCGAFSEIVRLHENNTVVNLEQFHAKQLSWSNVLPGVIKAFHLHYTQDDLWFVPPSESLLIGLFDCRENKTGTINLVNPGLIDHETILEMYKKYINPEHKYELMSYEDQRKILASERSNNELDTTKLENFTQVNNIKDGIEKIFQKW